MSCSFEQHSESQVFPAHFSGKTVLNLRYIRERQRYSIVHINHTISIYIHILDIARIYFTLKVLLRTGLYIFPVSEQAFGYISPLYSARISDSRLIRIVYIRLLVMQYLVARESKVTTYGSPPVFSKILFETEVSIHTPAFHRTCIGPRHRDETGFFRYSDTLLENVSTAIFKVVNSQREFIIEQVDIHTDIKLLRFFPDKSVST